MKRTAVLLWCVAAVLGNFAVAAQVANQGRCRGFMFDVEQYVWIYTEKPRWWSNQELPQAYVDALARARKPEGKAANSRRCASAMRVRE